ncbi:MAG: SCO1664 family protein [Actinomycetota bacterium]|nr:SCO1664 family protein [Actinomycetota bacterium]
MSANTDDVEPEETEEPGSADAPRIVDLRTATTILSDGEMELEARMPWSSNATFLVKIHHELGTAGGIYKPERGERPLWDFPSGLYRREVAAFELSDELGWGLVPPTVARDGVHGEGSVQLFIDADFEEHHFTLVEDEIHHEQLKRMAIFDVVANNTDRKSGHCLLAADGHIWGIDHGLCFSEDFKLRTVIWEFGGEPIDERELGDLAELEGGLPERLTDLLSRQECAALYSRILYLLEKKALPSDDTGRRYPWPLV